MHIKIHMKKSTKRTEDFRKANKMNKKTFLYGVPPHFMFYPRFFFVKLPVFNILSLFVFYSDLSALIQPDVDVNSPLTC